jgi:hypothetical protein
MSLCIINAGHTAHGITHLPDFELIGSDVVEYRLLLLLDCVLQVIDSFRQRNVNQKGLRIVEAEDAAGKRAFGGYV